MQPIRIGNFEIGRIADYQGPFFDPSEFFPDFDPAVVAESVRRVVATAVTRAFIGSNRSATARPIEP